MPPRRLTHIEDNIIEAGNFEVFVYRTVTEKKYGRLEPKTGGKKDYFIHYHDENDLSGPVKLKEIWVEDINVLKKCVESKVGLHDM